MCGGGVFEDEESRGPLFSRSLPLRGEVMPSSGH